MTDIIKQACRANSVSRITVNVLRLLARQAMWDDVYPTASGTKAVHYVARKGNYHKNLGTTKQAAEFFAVIIAYHTGFNAN